MDQATGTAANLYERTAAEVDALVGYRSRRRMPSGAAARPSWFG